MNTPPLEIDQLRVTARRRVLLDVPSLRLAPRSAVTLLGPNGAGKSTFVKACLGFMRPAAGSIRLLGHEVTRLGPLARAHLRRRAAYLPQLPDDNVHVPLTVREIVAIGRSGIRGLGRRLQREDWDLVDVWLERLGLQNQARQAFSELSGGERRKTLIARAMVQQPEVLILDEPTVWLDLGWRERIVQLLDALHAAEAFTLILVCHELEVIPRCCDRLLVLEHGQIVADGSPTEVLTDARIAELYGPGLRVLHVDGRHAAVPGAGVLP